MQRTGEAGGSFIICAGVWSQIKWVLMCHTNVQSMYEDILHKNYKNRPQGGTRGEVRGAPQSVGFILWG